MNKIDKIIDTIRYALEIGNPDNYKINEEEANMFLRVAEEGYVLVQWPESQEFMEEEWFKEEAILALGSEDKTGSTAYFIPIKRIV